MAASLALAGLAGGCSNQGEEKILPYVRAPEHIVPGIALQFATAMPMGPSTLGLLVTSREGRPIKIEGNELHPASQGATDAWAQASILTLYDPDRSQTVTHLGEISTWESFLTALRGNLDPLAGSGGEGVYIVSETVTSPTLARQMRAFREKYPKANWIQYEPINRDQAREGARLAFGRDLTPVYDFTRAKTVVSLDADFLCRGPGSVRYARDFMAGRKVRGEQKTMNRLFVVESTCTATGTAADHRLPLRPSEVGEFAVALAKRLGVAAVASLAAPAQGNPQADTQLEQERWLDAIVQDLENNRGAGVVLCGDHQPAWVHAVVHAINDRPGNHGAEAPIRFIEPLEAEPANQYESLRELTDALNAGKVALLVVLDGNPVYTAPGELNFPAAIRKAPTAVHFGLYTDETAELCPWHVPAAHYLESWSDARAYDGTASIVQPLIEPLYGGRTIHELMSALTDQAVKSSYDIVQATWQESGGDQFARRWQKALHDGIVEGSAADRVEATLQLDASALQSSRNEAVTADSTTDGLEIVLLPDPNVFDGRFANNGWLQELPKPITKLTWDNAVLLAPATAARLGVKNEDLVELRYNRQSLEAPVWVVPGHPAESTTVHLGYGRRRGGRVLENTGFDAYKLLGVSGARTGGRATLARLGTTKELAATQLHHTVEDLARRNIVHSGTLEDFKLDEHKIHGVGHHGDEATPTLYPPREFTGLQWGMAIDMTACVGCNACVVACQAENNIPIVGKEGVHRGREMHWLRLDLYYEGDEHNPQAVHQPMLCQHCETAPCEVVCPVMATSHSDEGLNEMTYNRCVGTRYCSNNCPYKVRRFNFLEYNGSPEPVLKLLRNPEVTVRSRGVMEKCTYCVQRINAARIAAKIEQVEHGGELQIKDGTLQTACQQVCPTKAIVFGNINDPDSEVARLKHEPLNYGVLSELGTRPRTTYLARLRNTHSDLT
jgi:molybdopterin-containing oxidoreductase family iron-sulfur binding subunit